MKKDKSENICADRDEFLDAVSTSYLLGCLETTLDNVEEWFWDEWEKDLKYECKGSLESLRIILGISREEIKERFSPYTIYKKDEN